MNVDGELRPTCFGSAAVMARESFHESGSQSPTSLSRTIEKVFDESQYTGEINLSGRKLKEYPKCACKYDLVDTTSAGNRPPVIALFMFCVFYCHRLCRLYSQAIHVVI